MAKQATTTKKTTAPKKKSARQINAEQKGSLQKTIGEPVVEGEAVVPEAEEVKSTIELQLEKLKNCPYPMPNFAVIMPGWNRVSNTTITQINDVNDPRGFRDKVLGEQKKNTYKYVVRFPRFSARQRNLWNVIYMSEDEREDLLKNRSRYAYEKDKADLQDRLKYMREQLGIDTEALGL